MDGLGQSLGSYESQDHDIELDSASKQQQSDSEDLLAQQQPQAFGREDDHEH